MFLSADSLSINYGVDDKIAKFFVDRQPPANNLYWKGKLLYLRVDPGWMFIPLIVDLLYRLGIDREELLSESFVGLMEQIGHISAEEELKLITTQEALSKYLELVKDRCKDDHFYNHLVSYLRGEIDNPFKNLATPYKALHRGDAFLFTLCTIDLKKNVAEEAVKYWFALISTLLLLDDAEDIEEDTIAGDENAFIESGLTKAGIENIKEMVMKNLQLISRLNNTMALKLDKSYIALLNKPFIQQILNS